MNLCNARKVPIYHTGATRDGFFLLQDSLFDTDKARDENSLDLWLRYLHNTQHSTSGAELSPGLISKRKVFI